MMNKSQHPTAFISYSHDSPEHKNWVVGLARRLRENSVEVMLDEWDARPGDDLLAFMERAIRSADRVLLICTESYTRKADERVGGVGYESMLATGELSRALSERKFIPIVRQSSASAKLPAAFATRFYVDLSHLELFESEFEKLLRELHNIPPGDKPPLGQHPFGSRLDSAYRRRGYGGELTRDSEAAESVATRFVRLFEAHGVHRNQISRVFGHGLAPVHLQSDATLMPVLTDAMLDAAAAMFAVRREWLDGASDQVYPLHDFYKKPREFGEFIAELRRQSPGGIQGIVLVAEGTDLEDTALVVLEQEIGRVGERPLYRYHVCNNWHWGYWKSRAYLTACVVLAWNAKAYLMGRRVPIEVIRQYREGTRFLEYGFDGALPLDGMLWHPEDMAVKPEVYLAGLDEGEFGIRQGLSLWLELEAEGFMKTDLPYANVRQVFERALAKVAPTK